MCSKNLCCNCLVISSHPYLILVSLKLGYKFQLQLSGKVMLIEWIMPSQLLGLVLNFPKKMNVIISGDWLGKLFALASLSPFGILSGFVALILFRRDLHTVSRHYSKY